MSLSNARLAYQDCFDIFDAALEDPKGVRIEQPDTDKAQFLRMRLHNARKIDRKDNTNIYPVGHPMYGQSNYDKLACRIRQEDGKVWLYIEQITLEGKIEGLSGPLQLPAPKQKLLEGPKEFEEEPLKVASGIIRRI